MLLSDSVFGIFAVLALAVVVVGCYLLMRPTRTQLKSKARQVGMASKRH